MNSKTIAILIGALIVVSSTTFLIVDAINTKEDSSISRNRSLDSQELSAEMIAISLEEDETTALTTTEVTTTTTMETTTQSTTVVTTEPTTTTAVTTTVATETTTEEATTTVFQPTKITANGVTVETISVSCLKVEWEAEEGRNYTVSCSGYGSPYFSFRGNSVCYITGLREGSEYEITVTPKLSESEKENSSDYECVTTETVGYTESVEVIQEFPREDGWTSCFAGEKASGLTRQPSSGAIYGSQVDEITNTGIRRFENGDYCCAMGLWYGTVGDRFLVELENGQQFTVRICDSKGWCDDADGDGIADGRFHWFGGEGNGKCVIEFIYDDYNLPSCVAYSGSWGYYSWEGLDLCSNILSIKKINY
jgi:hypothetical protein